MAWRLSRGRLIALLVLLILVTSSLSGFIFYYSVDYSSILYRIESENSLTNSTSKSNIIKKELGIELLKSMENWKVNKNLNEISSWPLLQYPDLPYDQNISCLPKKFGYTIDQANQLFDPIRIFKTCGFMHKPIIKLEKNHLNIKCKPTESPEYILGESPKNELFGEVEGNIKWKRYWIPLDVEDSEYIFARCSRWRTHAVLTNKFNLTASQRALNITAKLQKDLKMKQKPRPLSVFLILFDSLSRQHFYRNFPMTIKFLNESVYEGIFSKRFTMYDFVINNAHGENTTPNMVPLLYGHNILNISQKLEGFSMKNPRDWWKFREVQEESLWKYYEKLGYVTMFGYDTIWDFLSYYTGRQILTDHVATNFWHAAKKVYGYTDFLEKQKCFGMQNSHWYLLNYAYEFLENYVHHNRFGYIHISTAHESSGTVIRTADYDLREFFERVLYFYDKILDEDVVIHLMADHGKHSKEWDLRYEGYLENQLPLHIILSNKELIQKLDADEILKHNTQRLVSRLDWSLTFRHMALIPYGKLKVDSALYQDMKRNSDTSYAVSLLLEKIEDSRQCDQVDIPSHYCTCIEYTEVDLNNTNNQNVTNLLANLGIKSLNQGTKIKSLEEFCYSNFLNKIISAEVQILKDFNGGGNRIYKMLISSNEDPQAIFELNGLAAVSLVMPKYSKEDPNGIYPNGTYYTHTEVADYEMILQLQEIIRVDAQDESCTNFLKSINKTDSLCICKKNYNSTALVFPEDND